MARIIEIRPVGSTWKSFESKGVEPIFADQAKAIDYARTRAGYSELEIQVFDAAGKLSKIIKVDERERRL